jgi:hypothetical protein
LNKPVILADQQCPLTRWRSEKTPIVVEGFLLSIVASLELFGVGVAVSFLLILAHDRPFYGDLSVRLNPLLQVMPELESAI